MTLGCYIFCTSALCILSINNIIEAPALYNTAVSSAICFSVWSIYFYLKAIDFFTTDEINSKYLTIGALFGSLVFGCRPNIGLFNIIVVPVIYWIYSKYKVEIKRMVLKLLHVIVPYLLVGVLLMIYNYVRFDSVFEFGQSYQLTIADQHDYMKFSQLFNIPKLVDNFMVIFIGYSGIQNFFPYVSYSGILLCYPILWLFAPLFIIYWKERKSVDKRIYQFVVTVIISVLLIIFATIIMSPIPALERYKGDEYFLICIIMYMMIMKYINGSRKISNIIIILSVLTYLEVFLLYFAGESYIQFYYPGVIEYWSKVVWPF